MIDPTQRITRARISRRNRRIPDRSNAALRKQFTTRQQNYRNQPDCLHERLASHYSKMNLQRTSPVASDITSNSPGGAETIVAIRCFRESALCLSTRSSGAPITFLSPFAVTFATESEAA
jgi:hypothetical protein